MFLTLYYFFELSLFFQLTSSTNLTQIVDSARNEPTKSAENPHADLLRSSTTTIPALGFNSNAVAELDNISASTTKINSSDRNNVDSGSGSSVNEMLVPENSTTALICEPIFNENFGQKSATWYKDGRALAKVTGHTNAVLEGRKFEFEGPIPQVGFLIITNIQIEDEGEYWCARDDASAQTGERSRLTVAFIKPFDSTQIQHNIRQDDASQNDESLVLQCPETRALPKPTISWHYNDEPIDFSSGRFELHQNSLIVRHFDANEDGGVYECVRANFAGRIVARVEIPQRRSDTSTQTPKSQPRLRTKSISSLSCSGYLQNEILWFLIGCLSTSCFILLYLISGMIFFKCSKRGRRQRYHGMLPYSNRQAREDATAPTSNGRVARLWHFLRAGIDPNQIPGFRKVVAPVSHPLHASLAAQQSSNDEADNTAIILNSN